MKQENDDIAYLQKDDPSVIQPTAKWKKIPKVK